MNRVAYGKSGVTSDTVDDLQFGRVEDGWEVSARNIKLVPVVYRGTQRRFTAADKSVLTLCVDEAMFTIHIISFS